MENRKTISALLLAKVLGFYHYQRNGFCFSLLIENLFKINHITKPLLKGEC